MQRLINGRLQEVPDRQDAMFYPDEIIPNFDQLSTQRAIVLKRPTGENLTLSKYQPFQFTDQDELDLVPICTQG